MVYFVLQWLIVLVPHDAMAAMSGGLLEKLNCLPQHNLVGDSAFANTADGMLRMTDAAVCSYIYGDQLRSFRQISEWGMRIFQLHVYMLQCRWVIMCYARLF